MPLRVLITGGAGFIGSFLADALVRKGEQVRIFDNLDPQVHAHGKPAYLPPTAEFIEGDVRDRAALERALEDIEIVVHCASAVGVGQSQYEIERYTAVNAEGTATLLQIIVDRKLPIRKIIVPTSMTAYGEGLYRCEEHGSVRPGMRSFQNVKEGDVDVHCPDCRRVVVPIPTPETARQEGGSVYALTKRMQEDLILGIGATYGIPAVALRLFNVYGPRQSLSNPYTGVTAIFLSRLKNGQPPILYEDGLQSRDFVSVHDVVRAFLLAIDHPGADGHAINIGSGRGTSIREVAEVLSRFTGKTIAPRAGGCRKNDIRHCIADTAKAKKLLAWQPMISFEEGMEELVRWGEKEEATDKFREAEESLKAHLLQA